MQIWQMSKIPSPLISASEQRDYFIRWTEETETFCLVIRSGIPPLCLYLIAKGRVLQMSMPTQIIWRACDSICNFSCYYCEGRSDWLILHSSPSNVLSTFPMLSGLYIMKHIGFNGIYLWFFFSKQTQQVPGCFPLACFLFCFGVFLPAHHCYHAGPVFIKK